MKANTILHTHRNSRTLKVYSKYFQRRYGKHVNLPYIRLTGRWLEESGFKIGEYVRVANESNRIIITKVK